MSRATGRHTRPKKLTPKQNVHIFREEQVDAINDIDAVRNQVETGVEKAEESVSTYLLSHPSQLTCASGIPSATGHQSITGSETRSEDKRCIYPHATYHIK